MSNPIRIILNAAQWQHQNLGELCLTIVHRGAGNDRRLVLGARIAKVAAAGVELDSSFDADAEPTFIPYHRVLGIARFDEVLWERPGHTAMLQTPEPVSLPAEAEPEPDAVEVRRHDIRVKMAGSSEDLLLIDGSAGEGGGQILRSSLTLSMLTGRAFVLDNIRAGRKKPGLMRQHLTCVRAARRICGAEVGGAELGSGRLKFSPTLVKGGQYKFDIGTAGSVSLVLQTVLLPLALSGAASEVVISGGTHVRWAPPIPFLKATWMPLLRRMGVNANISLERSGFYPAGGGQVKLTIEPSSTESLKPLFLSAPEEAELSLHAVVANLSESIARRELRVAQDMLKDHGLDVPMFSSITRSPGPGNACWLKSESEQLTHVFTALGERGVRAEDVGASVVDLWLQWANSGAAVDEYLCDQLLLPVAIAGAGRYTCEEPSLHSWTNIEVIDAFLGRRVVVNKRGVLFEMSLG